MTPSPVHVAVIGAGLGGLRTIEALRRAGFPGAITLVGAESHLPYDRPPLSKQLLAGMWDTDRIRLADHGALAEHAVSLRLGVHATALHPGRVDLADGTSVVADAVVIATGVVARRLQGQPAGVHTLRTLDDAIALRQALGASASALVVGAGFIGAEVASTASTQGVAVTVLEAQDAPFAAVLGADAGDLCSRLLRENGIDLRTATAIERFVDTTSGVAVELSDGTRLAADTAVVGIGGTPAVSWLAGTGLDLASGLRCDERGRVEGLENVWAVGDVAAWLDPSTGVHHRHEHWNSAVDQASVVARDIVGGEPVAAPIPYFWSDQFGLKIQVLGEPRRSDTVVQLHGEALGGGAVKGTVLGYFAAGRLVAVTGFGAPGHVARYRVPLAGRATHDAVRAFAAAV